MTLPLPHALEQLVARVEREARARPDADLRDLVRLVLVELAVADEVLERLLLERLAERVRVTA